MGAVQLENTVPESDMLLIGITLWRYSVICDVEIVVLRFVCCTILAEYHRQLAVGHWIAAKREPPYSLQ